MGFCPLAGNPERGWSPVDRKQEQVGPEGRAEGEAVRDHCLWKMQKKQ